MRALLAFAAGLAGFEHPEDFRTGILPGLREIVPCDLVTYNEVEFEAGRMIAAEDPPGSMIPEAPEIFVRYGHQNPIAARYRRTRDGRAYKWSDFIDRRALHATDLYRDLYRRMGVEHQMAICLPAPPSVVIGIAFNRGRRDFDERDRMLLNLTRSSLIRAYRTVERYAAVSAALRSAERGLDHRGATVLVLEGRGEGSRVTSVIGYSDGMIDGAALPAQVQRWLAAAAGNADTPPLLHQASSGERLLLRFLPSRHAREPDSILVEPATESLTLAGLKAAGLTLRQAEVMRLVAFGRGNQEIARALAISPRTVAKHLQHAYDRLGVNSRTQAVATVWSIDRAVPLVERPRRAYSP